MVALSQKINFLRHSFVFILALFVGGYCFPAHAASIQLVPVTGSYAVGDMVQVIVSLKSTDQSANAVSGDIAIPNNTFTYASFSKGGSIIGLWAEEPSFSSATGLFHFEGIILNPGYQGPQGKILTLTLRATHAGSANLSFSSGSVLANDGKGTNILEDMGKASYSIFDAVKTNAPLKKQESAPSASSLDVPVVRSESHPNPDQWYSKNDIILAWDLPEGVDNVSYAMHASADFIPGSSQSKGVVSQARYKAQDYNDGIWYFHARFHSSSGWGPVTTRKVKIDTTAPDAPRIAQEDGAGDLTDPRPVLSWSSKDAKSGIASYEIRIDGGATMSVQPEEAKQYQLPTQGPGEHHVQVIAIDGAGNHSEGSIVVSIQPLSIPTILTYTKAIHAPREELVISGKASPGMTVHLLLASGVSRSSFSTQADQHGIWDASYSDPLAPGVWTLTAYGEDSRGARSEETKGVTISVQAWVWNIVREFIGWGFIALVLMAIGFGICYAWFILFHHVRMARSRMQKDLLAFKKELQHDMEHLNDDIASLERSNSVDLKTGVQRKGHLAGDVRHVQEDIEKELKKLSKEG